MGSVTSIDAYDPNRPFRVYPTTGTTSTLTYVTGSRASIKFDAWETAIAAAMVAARSSANVKVNKVGADWVVSWDAPVLINPTPTYPSPYYPYTVSWNESS